MSNTSVTFRIDENLKKEAESILADIGMNLTTAFTIYAKAVVRHKGIPFELTSDPFYSQENQSRIKRAIAALDAGQGQVHELIED